MLLRNGSCNVEAQSQSSRRTSLHLDPWNTIELLPDVRPLLRCDPWTLIVHGNDGFPVASLQRDGDGSSLRRILVRVREQIQERLTDASWIHLSLEMVIKRLKCGIE